MLLSNYSIMRTILRNKIIKALVVVAALAGLYLLFIYKTPEQLASEAKYIPQFFGLTKSDFLGFDGEMYIVDEIHS